MLLSPPKAALIIPSQDDVLKFAKEIRFYRLPKIGRGYSGPLQWATQLHELGHWAVYTDANIKAFLDSERAKGTDPLKKAGRIPLRSEIKCSQTPDEWGVRAWCLQVLDFMGWENPLKAVRSDPARSWDYINIGAWKRDGVNRSSLHTLPKNGFDQLAAVGIDVPNGIFRPKPARHDEVWEFR